MKKDDLYNYLPLASVIKIKNSNKLLMIAKIINNPNSNYNYRCIQYPDGFYQKQLFKDISKEDIEKVYFIGYKPI